MPQTNNLHNSQIAFLYTEIGRGHPCYLDGIIDQFEKSYPDITYYVTDVFAVSKGLSLLAWHAVKLLYRLGAKGGLITRLYGILRQNSDSGGALIFWLGRNIKTFFTGYNKPVIVAHPILATIMGDQNNVIYQHGELAAPAESMVFGCRKILIPLPETAIAFKGAGISKDVLTITGQCIELDLAARAKKAFTKRIKRLKSPQLLTVALFSSGAYPPDHVKKILLTGKSLFESGYTVILFMGQSHKARKHIFSFYRKLGLPVSGNIGDANCIRIISSFSRQEENRQVAAVFDSLDFFIAPSHERTNWAVGLGLPLFILCPHIGSYALLNAAIAMKQGVALEIPDNSSAAEIAEVLDTLRKNGKLLQMALCGFGGNKIDGFAQAAKVLRRMVER